MRDNEQLIKGLATSFGMGNSLGAKYSASKFDAATGTLYCEGVSIPKTTIKTAYEYFERQKAFFKASASTDPASMEQYLVNVVASNAILMLMNNVSNKEES